ncbi:MAG: hypothetical protein R3C01_05585 [Planctomycetaceae bacterium]
MRKLKKRPSLPATSIKKLAEKTAQIVVDSDPKGKADSIYSSARSSNPQWFQEVVNALRTMSGAGERCMFCSGSESSDVEHFQPKSIFPHLAMTWDNFLWSCTICNRFKSNRFPPDTEPGPKLINPCEENVWDFFYVDEFGNLSPRWRTDLNDLDPRAVKTQEILKLDRQALQESRQLRLRELKQQVRDAVQLYQQGKLSKAQLKQRRKAWLKAPFQPDVADYCFLGPGNRDEPYHTFLSILT